MGDFNCYSLFWDSKGTSNPRGRKYSIGSSLLTSSPSMTLTYLLFSIVPPLSSPFLSPLSPYLAPGGWFRTWLLITYQFFYLSFSLWSFAPTSVPLPSTFRKLAGMTLYFTFTLTVLLQRNTAESLSLSSAAALFTSLTLDAAKSSIPFGRIKRHLKSWWSAEVEKAISERRKAFAAARKSDEDHQVSISAFRRVSSDAPRPKLNHDRRLALLSPKSNSKSMCSLVCSIAGSSSSSSSCSDFPNSFSPREPILVFTNYLRSHFSVSQSKNLRSRARDYLSKLRRATRPEKSHPSFSSPFLPAKFLAGSSNLSLSAATDPDNVVYSMLKHLSCSGMDFLLHIFNFSWILNSFPSIWKTSYIIPIHKMGKPLNSPASFQPISLTSCE